ncbi:MAG: leucine--tRNA ligase [Calditrichaeota bacterium]|nr:leucine--tRNA ligase [Calditrichota bacterium]
MDSYPFQEIETKWRSLWEKRGVNHVDLNTTDEKRYILVMFSYPSEKKLHIGHWWNYGPTDSYARFLRMHGYKVFEPMGFDAFGLPAENFAIKHGVHPGEITRDSVSHIREQLKLIGAMYDWGKEVNTSQPDYYKWTQWLFLQLFNTGNAYRKHSPVNWCTKCKTVLANEQVLADGSCERCDSIVETHDMEQWFFKITAFADELLEGLDEVEWPESTKSRQRHWIGRSEGTEIVFDVVDSDEKIRAFTTRPDTLFGVTYVVLAPENEMVRRITNPDNRAEVEDYVKESRAKSDIERLSSEQTKSGVFTGAYAINPGNSKKVPIWIADYVLASYGTGAVMAVPAHDQRDFEFAKRYKLSVAWVIDPLDAEEVVDKEQAYTAYGVIRNSGKFSGIKSSEGKFAVTNWLSKISYGKATVTYRLRDWSVSRQRYWGAPIPIIHCPDCGLVPVPESDLPVILPEEIEDFTPRGKSPLGAISSFIETECPKCGKPAKRDPDTMDTFVDSSWYYLRYTSTEFDDRPFDKERVKKWLPVDTYVGGPEHATGHLIYARYIAKFLKSQGHIDVSEPFKRMIHQGIITYKGHRMSKSKGNVVNPDAFIDNYGADCFRLYLMFMGDYTVGGDWSDEGIVGIRRFQNRIWRLVNEWSDKDGVFKNEKLVVDADINRRLHYTIKSVSNNLHNFQFNTAISRLMELVNDLYLYIAKKEKVNRRFLNDVLEKMVIVLAPLAPHFGEELWEVLGKENSVFYRRWPDWDAKALEEASVTVAVQINGKMVSTIDLAKGSSEEDAFEKALDLKKVMNQTMGKTIFRKIFVKDRIVNLVVK